MKVEVPFQQLLTVVKALTPAQKARLQAELIAKEPDQSGKDAFIDFLLHGPVYTEKDLNTIEDNRKSITTWRTKS